MEISVGCTSCSPLRVRLPRHHGVVRDAEPCRTAIVQFLRQRRGVERRHQPGFRRSANDLLEQAAADLTGAAAKARTILRSFPADSRPPVPDLAPSRKRAKHGTKGHAITGTVANDAYDGYGVIGFRQAGAIVLNYGGLTVTRSVDVTHGPDDNVTPRSPPIRRLPASPMPRDGSIPSPTPPGRRSAVRPRISTISVRM